jgi:hypothetical protein
MFKIATAMLTYRGHKHLHLILHASVFNVTAFITKNVTITIKVFCVFLQHLAILRQRFACSNCRTAMVLESKYSVFFSFRAVTCPARFARS